jgi:ATP-binding cassette subfamily B multidrug efflux pump
LDADGEAALLGTLQSLKAENRTVILITHKTNILSMMDKILVLHKGSVREAGTHQQLLAARGIYFKLFQLQYKQDVRTGELAADLASRWEPV